MDLSLRTSGECGEGREGVPQRGGQGKGVFSFPK